MILEGSGPLAKGIIRCASLCEPRQDVWYTTKGRAEKLPSYLNYLHHGIEKEPIFSTTIRELL